MDGRLRSVDAFRGITILAMILVNNPGDWGAVYPPLLHAEWHGWTPTDLIFPFFLLIVGVAIVLAFEGRLERAAAAERGAAERGARRFSLRFSLASKAVRRAVILFALGLFLTGYPFGLFGPRSFEALLDSWRIPGVLQRIAVCYLVAALLFLFCRGRMLKGITAALLLGYWVLITRVPVPGLGAPDLDSKGDHLAGWLDRTVLGSHLWSYGKVYDPEGILSTLPALATTLFGVFAGQLLVSKLEPVEKTARLLVWGSLATAAGYVWGWFFPINKALWTSSYALFTAGLAGCGLALCHWFFDVRGHHAWARPWEIYGVNALTVFVGSGVLARTLAYAEIGGESLQRTLYETFFASWLPPHAASLGYALAWIAGWFLVLWWMARKRWIVKV